MKIDYKDHMRCKMERFKINGRKKLNGTVTINGAKNAVLPIVAASVLANDVCTIESVPPIEDVFNIVKAMQHLGVDIEWQDETTLRIDSSGAKNIKADFDCVRQMRASYYLLGAYLGRFNKASVAFPGGCDFGTRPIDQHIKGFEALGAKVTVNHGIIEAQADKLVGTSIFLDVASVGATINLMLASVKAEGTTVIENAAKEPHVVDTANFLNSLGANVKGAGTDIIKITGVKELHGTNYMVIPDQIEAGTYMIAGAISGGDVIVNNVIPKHMEAITAKLVEMGVTIEEYDEAIRVCVDKPLNSIKLKTLFYPGFPTDMQPQMAVLLSNVSGTSIITESVFDNRFQYTDQLTRMGAAINVEGRMAVIEGAHNGLSGAEVKATDLRAGAAMVLAGLAAEGETVITNIKYIDRGYLKMEENLRQLGADIQRVQVADVEDIEEA